MNQIKPIVKLNISKKQMYIIVSILSILFLLIGILYFSGFLGSIFQKPPPPPEEYSKGRAKILAYDPLNDQYINCEIKLYYYENETLYNTTSTNTTLYIPEASLALISAKEYYNVCISVLASETSIYNQTIYMYKRPNLNDVQINITKIDDVWGVYSPSDIPNGQHDVTFAIGLKGSSKNTTHYGEFCYVPSSEIGSSSLANTYNLSFYGSWIVFNCTNITNIRYTFDESGFQYIGNVYNVGNGNKTIIFITIFRTMTITLRANFTNINSIFIHTGLIDNLTSEKIIL